jgi:hypothetical protein
MLQVLDARLSLERQFIALIRFPLAVFLSFGHYLTASSNNQQAA